MQVAEGSAGCANVIEAGIRIEACHRLVDMATQDKVCETPI